MLPCADVCRLRFIRHFYFAVAAEIRCYALFSRAFDMAPFDAVTLMLRATTAAALAMPDYYAIRYCFDYAAPPLQA